MKRIIVLIIFVLSSFVSNAQFRNYPIKIGFHANLAQPYTEFYESDNYKIPYDLRLFTRFELGKQFEGEVSAGYLKYAGIDRLDKYYRSNIYPLDFKFIYNPFQFEKINPFVYAGVGAALFHYVIPPKEISPDKVTQNEITGIIPLGAGVEFLLTKSVFFNISAGYTHFLTDGANKYAKKNTILTYDGSFNLGAGLTFVINPGSKDRDNDGLSNDIEEELKTDPDNPDTDGDGLKDGDEINKYKSNPLKADTDGDGLSDYDEVMKYQTNVNLKDSDNDGLSDYAEVETYSTNPNKSDTDGDGLTDGDEVTKYNTNPKKLDSDGDKLSDGDEVLKYKTDPLKADTDGGTIDDGTEVSRNTNPLAAGDDVVKQPVVEPVKEEPIVLEGIIFASNKAQITKSSEKILQNNLVMLNKKDNVKFEIIGYTDNVGNREKNIVLSQRRADAVKNWFIAKGINAERISAKGLGPDNPIASNDKPEGRQKNRRIELVIIK
jgi:outer membrane protein OmpA-like peptidoglycan-associated protein